MSRYYTSWCEFFHTDAYRMLRGLAVFPLCVSAFAFLLQHSHIVLLLATSSFLEPTGGQNTSPHDRKPAGINQVAASSKINMLTHPPDHSLRSTTAILYIYIKGLH